MKLAFDTETTGLYNFKLPASDPSQPHLCQLGMILLDSENRTIHEVGLVVNPGIPIPTEVSDIHGITSDIAKQYGVPESYAIEIFRMMCDRAQLHIGHNLKFDSSIMEATFARHQVSYLPYSAQEQYCTMLTMTPLCKLPGYQGRNKWPKLQEAYKWMFQKELVDAHDALSDVRATVELYKMLTVPNPMYDKARGGLLIDDPNAFKEIKVGPAPVL